MTRNASGFTLIELLIVVAIVAILSAIAIPAYQSYVVRAQVSEGLTMLGGLKAGIVEHHAATGRFPTSLEQIAATSPTGRFVDSVQLLDGALVITYGGEASDVLLDGAHNTLALAFGETPAGGLVWQCGSAAQPRGASWVADAAALTTIEANYLPTPCR